MSGAGRLRSDWNQALLEHVLPPLYARLLMEVCVGVCVCVQTLPPCEASHHRLGLRRVGLVHQRATLQERNNARISQHLVRCGGGSMQRADIGWRCRRAR
jgi:hypothetical protein